ncbi:hypothetical protein [Burkholderia sp. PU8-34]
MAKRIMRNENSTPNKMISKGASKRFWRMVKDGATVDGARDSCPFVLGQPRRRRIEWIEQDGAIAIVTCDLHVPESMAQRLVSTARNMEQQLYVDTTDFRLQRPMRRCRPSDEDK